VAISMLSYATGFGPPLEELGPELQRRGVLLYVDGTQGVGALEFDVSRVRPAMLAVHAYKWMLSPNGAGFLYVSPELRERLTPNVIGWRSHKDWRNFEQLHQGAPVFAAEAERYEGGIIAFTLIYAMGAVIEMMLDIGPGAIERRVLELAEGVRGILEGAGAILPEYRSPIVAARFEGVDTAALVPALKERGVLVAARLGLLRVSPHFYNNEEDLERFREALTMVLCSR